MGAMESGAVSARIPICLACWRKHGFQPEVPERKPGQPWENHPEAECGLCEGLTWAGLTEEETYARAKAMHRAGEV